MDEKTFNTNASFPRGATEDTWGYRRYLLINNNSKDNWFSNPKSAFCSISTWWVSGVWLCSFSFRVSISAGNFQTHLCQNSRFGHVVFQPRSFLATANSSKFRGFLLVKSGETTSFSLVSTSVSVLRLSVAVAI